MAEANEGLKKVFQSEGLIEEPKEELTKGCVHSIMNWKCPSCLLFRTETQEKEISKLKDVVRIQGEALCEINDITASSRHEIITYEKQSKMVQLKSWDVIAKTKEVLGDD